MTYPISLLLSKNNWINPEDAKPLQKRAAILDGLVVIFLIASFVTVCAMQLDHWAFVAFATGSLAGIVMMIDLLAWRFFGNAPIEEEEDHENVLDSRTINFSQINPDNVEECRLNELNRCIDRHRSVFIYTNPKVTTDKEWFYFPAISILPPVDADAPLSHAYQVTPFGEDLYEITDHLLGAIKQDQKLRDSILSFKVSCTSASHSIVIDLKPDADYAQKALNELFPF